jgi:large subunit ribosomal protein L30
VTFVVVRVRGTVNVNGGIQDTMKMLRLTRPNHAVVIPKTDAYVGMLNKVKDYVAYGEVDQKTLEDLIRTRGRLMGDKPIDDAAVNAATKGKFKTVADFAKAVADGKASIKDLGEEAKPVFRLHPPKGGQDGSTKRHFTVGGVLGYHGKEINSLVRRMI